MFEPPYALSFRAASQLHYPLGHSVSNRDLVLAGYVALAYEEALLHGVLNGEPMTCGGPHIPLYAQSVLSWIIKIQLSVA